LSSGSADGAPGAGSLAGGAAAPVATTPMARSRDAVLCRGRHELAAMIEHSLPAASLRALGWDLQP